MTEPTTDQQRLSAIRALGYTVAVHNDYRLSGRSMTFWVFTHPDGTYVKGEGESDDEALSFCQEAALSRQLPTPKADEPTHFAENAKCLSREGGEFDEAAEKAKVEELRAIAAKARDHLRGYTYSETAVPTSINQRESWKLADEVDAAIAEEKADG